jgi:hypothetical protein
LVNDGHGEQAAKAVSPPPLDTVYLHPLIGEDVREKEPLPMSCDPPSPTLTVGELGHRIVSGHTVIRSGLKFEGLIGVIRDPDVHKRSVREHGSRLGDLAQDMF